MKKKEIIKTCCVLAIMTFISALIAAYIGMRWYVGAGIFIGYILFIAAVCHYEDTHYRPDPGDMGF